MQRVSFLIEATGVRLPCLLNPETLVVRRLAGVRPRRSAAGALTGSPLPDDPLLHTGGGRTELDLDLLFDVTLAGASVSAGDVRDLTAPLWNLVENGVGDDGYPATPAVRFVWGKSWNVPGVVVSAAERLENFTSEGVARRSWLRLRMWRVGEPAGGSGAAPSLPVAMRRLDAGALAALPGDAFSIREVGGGDGPDGAERLDQFLARHQVPPQHWKQVAALNGIADPLRIAATTPLRLPPSGGAR